MADILYWSDEYSKHLYELEKLIDVTSKSVGDGKGKGIVACDDEIVRLKEIKKSFGLELRMIKDKSLKVQYDTKSKENDVRLADMIKEVGKLKANNDKQELVQGVPRSVISTEGKSNEDLLLGGVKIQEKTMESLERTKMLIEQSKEVGTATLEVLHQQRDQIKDIDVEISAIDNNLQKAEKLITNFARRIATDRAIQILSTLNIMILIAIIVYVIYTKKGLSSSSSKNDFVVGGDTLVPTSFPSAAPHNLR